MIAINAWNRWHFRSAPSQACTNRRSSTPPN